MSPSETSDFVREPAKDVPVAYDVDVVVAGSGIAGSMAALAAARQGAETVVVDRFGQLGGNMGPGMWAGGSIHLALAKDETENMQELVNRQGMGGIPEEFHRRAIFTRPNVDQMPSEVRAELEKNHMNVAGYRMGSGGGLSAYLADSVIAGQVLMEMMDEAGVEMLLSAYAADPIMQDNCVTGLFVETKSGRLAIKAKVVVDATGQADIAFRAGAPVLKARNPNLGLYFVFGGVERGPFFQFKAENEKPAPDDVAWANATFVSEFSEADQYRCPPHMLHAARQAWQAGEFEYVRPVLDCAISVMLKENQFREGMGAGRTGTIGAIDFADAKLVSLMECEHRGHVFRLARFLKKYIPGFENSYLMLIAPFLGARGGRYLDSVHPITGDDVKAGRRFEDAIYIFSSDKAGGNCDIPYRTLVPKNIDGLLAAGRSSFIYGPNFRVRYSALLNGQAAGVAAALASQEGVQPRDLDVKKLQQALHKLNCPLGNHARLVELGLTQ